MGRETGKLSGDLVIIEFFFKGRRKEGCCTDLVMDLKVFLEPIAGNSKELNMLVWGVSHCRVLFQN